MWPVTSLAGSKAVVAQPYAENSLAQLVYTHLINIRSLSGSTETTKAAAKLMERSTGDQNTRRCCSRLTQVNRVIMGSRGEPGRARLSWRGVRGTEPTHTLPYWAGALHFRLQHIHRWQPRINTGSSVLYMIYWTPVFCNGWSHYLYRRMWPLIFRSRASTVPSQQRETGRREWRMFSVTCVQKKGRAWKQTCACVLSGMLGSPQSNRRVRTGTIEGGTVCLSIISEHIYLFMDSFLEADTIFI